MPSLPLAPNTAGRDVVVDGADAEPARGEASNKHLPVCCAIFLLASRIGYRLVRIQAGTALDVLHEESNSYIEDVRHFVAGILFHELLLIVIGFVLTAGDHIATKDGPVRSSCGLIFILTEIEAAVLCYRAPQRFLDELSEIFKS